MKPSLLSKLFQKTARAADALRTGGPGALVKYLRFLKRNVRARSDYQEWLFRFGTIDDGEIDRRFAEMSRRPMISVIVPVYNTDEKWLRHCVDSVLDQIYPNWELCIADDASPAAHVRAVLQEYESRDERIKVVFRERNGHISAASNSALEIATGEFVALLDHDDELSPDALFWIANEVDKFPETAMIYTDEDLIDISGRRSDPKFKPDFSRDLFYSTNLITHLAAYRTDLVRRIGGFRVGFEGSQDYDLALRVIEQVDEEQIRHIPRVLYHWRTIRGSVAYSMDEKPYAHERARTAIREHLERTGFTVEVREASHDLHRVVYRLPDERPAISIIVSSDDRNIPARIGENDEVLHVPLSRQDRALRLNEAVSRSSAEGLFFLDGDLSLRSAGDTVAELATFALQPGIGAVAGRILARDFFVEQCGLVVQRDLSTAYAHEGIPIDAAGDLSRNRLIGNFSAVSISCFAISRKSFDAVGGFDRELEMFDLDLCLKLREKGKRIVTVPHLVFVRTGQHQKRNCRPDELARLRSRWPEYVEADPFCNRHLKRDGSFTLEGFRDRDRKNDPLPLDLDPPPERE